MKSNRGKVMTDSEKNGRSPMVPERTADGREQYVRPEILQISRNFGAGFDPPPEPSNP